MLTFWADEISLTFFDLVSPTKVCNIPPRKSFKLMSYVLLEGN